MLRRAKAEDGRLADEMTMHGLEALIAVITDDSLDYAEVLKQLQFVKKLKFNKDFDLISAHDINRHFARHGVEDC